MELIDEEPLSLPDNRGPAIVITGSLVVGLKFYGPFATIDAAVAWCEKTLLWERGTIALLDGPTTLTPPRH